MVSYAGNKIVPDDAGEYVAGNNHVSREFSGAVAHATPGTDQNV